MEINERGKHKKRLRPRKKRYKKRKIEEPATRVRCPRRYRRIITFSGNALRRNKNDDNYYRMNILKKCLPENLRYILLNAKSPFYVGKIKNISPKTNGYVLIPVQFSVILNPIDSFTAIREILSALFLESATPPIFDYKNCNYIGLETQAIMDVILKEHLKFYNRAKTFRRFNSYFPNAFSGININQPDLKKMLFTVGSPANLGIKEAVFPDIIKCPFRIHSMSNQSSRLDMIEKKEIDTTEMADYVINCMQKMNRTLTPYAIDNLCTVIGEILINAEEHSSTRNRISVGYFQEKQEGEQHYGVFKLVILNFGQSIYEKFKDPQCPNHDIVQKMDLLSKSYSNKSFFNSSFDEENLWTLYSLQDGVTSVAGQKRGGGSIRFIESFFNLKGSPNADNESVMYLLSGNTRIDFDGTYGVVSKNEGKESYRMVTFNDSGNISDKPDKRYVYKTENYFPGTIIIAKIRINENDIKNI